MTSSAHNRSERYVVTPTLELRHLVGQSPLGPLGKTAPIDLTLLPGQCGVVLGGKETSSLFRLIMGSGEIESGEIMLHGRYARRPGSGATNLVKWRQSIGFAFREKGLISNLTLHENVDLPAKYHGRYISGAPRGSFADAALGELEIDPAVWGFRPNRISWDIRKKVLLARAIVLTPKLLILDDPSALVASPSLPGLLAWIKRQQAKGTAVLLGTNDYPVGLALADWILHPTKNRPVTVFDDLVDRPWLEAARLLASQVEQKP